MDLRLLRTTRRLTVAAIARQAGWSRQRVSAIEASDRPTAAARDRYYLALAAAAAERDKR